MLVFVRVVFVFWLYIGIAWFVDNGGLLFVDWVLVLILTYAFV